MQTEGYLFEYTTVMNAVPIRGSARHNTDRSATDNESGYTRLQFLLISNS